MSPTQLGSPGRNAKSTKHRREMQQSQSPEDLLSRFQKALANGCTDASLVGAAMQRCGQGRWWDALLQVRRLQKKHGIQLFAIERNIYLTALGKSVRGEHGFGPMLTRQNLAVTYGQEMWTEAAEAKDQINFNAGLTAAFTLCIAAANSDGLTWAEELWASSGTRQFQVDAVSHIVFTHLLATHSLNNRVDDMIDSCPPNGWVVYGPFLGALLNVAADNRDQERASIVWKKLVVDFKVQPKAIEYAALVKCLLLCGNPLAAVNIIDKVRSEGIELTPNLAEGWMQNQLVVYHSSLDLSERRLLKTAIRVGAPVIRASPELYRRTWMELKSVASRVLAIPKSIKLHEVLVEWKATQSNMSKWRNYAAGSNYLKHKCPQLRIEEYIKRCL